MSANRREVLRMVAYPESASGSVQRHVGRTTSEATHSIRPLTIDQRDSLEVELAGNEAILRLLEDQKAYYTNPEEIPIQVKRQAEILRKRSIRIREILKTG